ncbi:MAG: Fic family protein [Nitrospiraceae bacterium]|nr:Fic family protein [Nitrospiraceae bacterium]
MKKSARYSTSYLPESQSEPGSRGRVLKNLLHITGKRKMDIVEAELFAMSIPMLASKFDRDHRLTAEDVCSIHKLWLGDVYEWAGRYRQVNVSKDGFSFAMARHVPKLMQDFEKGPLKIYTPCRFKKDEETITALAVVHTELTLIHPFREGNGRAGRLLAVVMAFQAGLPGLDFTGIRGGKRKEYVVAVQSGLDQNYEPMKKIFRSVLSRTRRTLVQR